MSQQNKLKDALRGYYDNQTVPFSDSEWEKASAHLNKSRRKKKLFYSFSIAAIILTITSITFFNTLSRTDFTKEVASAEQKSFTPANVSAAEQKTKDLSPSIKSSHLPNKNLSSAKSSLNSSSTVIQKRTTRANNASVSPVKESINKQTISDSKTTLSHSDDTKKTSTHDLLAGYDPSTESELKAQTTITRHKTSKAANTQALGQEATTLVSNSATNLDDDKNQSTASNTTPLTEDRLTPLETTVAVAEQKKELIANEKPIDVEALPTPSTSATEVTSTPTLSDVAEDLQIPMNDTLPEPVDLTWEGIFYELGTAWNYGWKGAEYHDARGFSPLAGIHYMNSVTNRFAFSFGLQYLQVRNLSNSSKTSRVSSYAYGEQNKVTVVTPSAMHYLAVPLKFHYYLNRRNSLGMGANFGYLLNIDAIVKTYDEKPGSTTNYKTIKQSGYTEGFSWFDTQLSVVYTRKIGNSLALQAELFVGLVDIKQDDFFGDNQKENNSGAKISLIYYAFKKKNR